MKSCLDCTHCRMRLSPALPHYCRNESLAQIVQRLIKGDPLRLNYGRLDYEQRIRCAKHQWTNRDGVERVFKDFENLRNSPSVATKYLSKAEECAWYDGEEENETVQC